MEARGTAVPHDTDIETGRHRAGEALSRTHYFLGSHSCVLGGDFVAACSRQGGLRQPDHVHYPAPDQVRAS